MATVQSIRLAQRRGRWSVADAVLALLVISVVGLMVVPLPTWLLDILLAGNLAASVALLLVSLYVSDALKIAAFPTLLLITTLVRLALNVSSTRLILLQADAGQVIRAFGQFVVQSNYVVGAVIFLILAIIQFVVIAKGSERVAEVGARFTLDAMPGKQMAIDAELRSGGIDGNEAKRRRRLLARESQFYGAMDGAMKFVKGDVIASFLITTINILGGLAIGMGQRDMEATQALKRYGLLTIGDGLVSQIPALVIATAAGVLVTRVASDEPDTPLGQELSSQLLGQPRALRVASVFVVMLAAVPGLPTLPFLLIGALLFIASRARQMHMDREALGKDEVVIKEPGQHRQRFVPVVVPWGLGVSSDFSQLVDDDLRGDKLRRVGLRSVGTALRELVFRQTGVVLPPCRVAPSEELPARHVVLMMHELPALAVVVPETVSEEELAEHVMTRLLPLVSARAHEYLGISETQALLDELEQLSPALVRQVVPKPVSLATLTDVLRRLAEEGVSIRDLKAILEALAQVGPVEKDPLNLAEFVRSQLRRSISYRLAPGARELEVFLLEPAIEETIRSAVSRTTSGSFLTLAPAAGRDIVTALQRALSAHDGSSPKVLLTQPDIRRFVKKLVETDLPDLIIVSYAELLPQLKIRPIAKATLAGL